jgi:hypothetical protein
MSNRGKDRRLNNRRKNKSQVDKNRRIEIERRTGIDRRECKDRRQN